MRWTILLCLFLCTQHLCSQEIPTYTLREAVQAAEQSGKLIFVQFESEKCGQCNEVADKGLSREQVASSLQQTFVFIKIGTDHPDRAEIGNRYNIANSFGVLVIDKDLTLINSLQSSGTDAKTYLEFIDASMMKAGEGMRISTLEAEYKKGNRSPGLVEMLLQKRRALKLTYDDLLEAYVRSLPSDSLTSQRTLTFIADFSPVLDSYPDSVLRRDAGLFNKVWYAIPLNKRISINSATIFRSMQKAISTKNELFAKRVASFARNTYQSNFEAGTKSYEANMLRFYKETNDTTQYFIKATAYYDRFYMQVPVEQIHREDSLQKESMLRAAIKSGKGKKEQIGDSVKRTITLRFAPKSQGFAQSLNNAAWTIYTMTDNPYMLSVATKWIEKGLEFYSSPEILDTYAKLLYALGQKQKATNTIEEAIKVKMARGFSVAELKQTLDKMQRGVALK